MKKKAFAILCAALMIATLAGCSASPGDSSGAASGTPSDSGSGGQEKIKVGITMISTTDEFCATMVEGMNYAIEELGGAVEVYLVDSVFDQAKQLDHIDTFMAQGVDVAVVQPVNFTSSTAGITKLNEAGIPVLEFCTKSDGGDYVYIGSADYDGGYAQGEWVAGHAPENATYVYLMCAMGEASQVERQRGFEDALKASGRDDLKKLSEQSANAARDQALKVTEDWIQAFGSFDLLVSQNDAMGALEALRTANIEDTIIVGVDGNKDAIQSIADGIYSATFMQQGYKMGYDTVMTAYWIATGDSRATGEDEILPFVMIDETNCDEFLDMGVKDFIEYKS